MAKQLIVNTNGSNDAQFQLSSVYSSASPGRKQIIFNRQSPKRNNVLLQKSTGSQDFEEGHSALKVAKLQQNEQYDTTKQIVQESTP